MKTIFKVEKMKIILSIISVFAVLMFVGTTTDVYAGWLDNLGKKAEQRAEDRIKGKVENQVNKTVDAAIDKSFETASDAVIEAVTTDADAANTDNTTKENTRVNEKTEADKDPWGN